MAELHCGEIGSRMPGGEIQLKLLHRLLHQPISRRASQG
jgi:hypothetical protein